MEKWTELFEPQILRRGKFYQMEDRVEELLWEDGLCRAVVCGTEDYEVTIEYSQDGVEEMSCTCPYACNGHTCKHMAAVLYALEAEQAPSILEAPPAPPSASELIQSLTDAQLRDFLTELAQKDAAIRKELSIRYGKHSAADQKRLLLSEMRSITDKYTDYGLIPYEDADDYAEEMGAFLENRPMSLLTMGAPEMALEVVFRALLEYSAQEGAECDWLGISVEDTAHSCCLELIGQCTTGQKRSLVPWLHESPHAERLRTAFPQLFQECIDVCLEGKTN